MFAYRLAKKEYIEDLSGTGARMYGGRWNRKGTSLLYTSENQSLAVIELLIHASVNTLPNDIFLLKLHIPDYLRIESILPDKLSENWRTYPAPVELADMGSKWVLSETSVALKVPSVIIPDESNILLNPLHPSFEEINIENISSFQIDSRLLKQG